MVFSEFPVIAIKWRTTDLAISRIEECVISAVRGKGSLV